MESKWPTDSRKHYTAYPARLLYLPKGIMRLEKLGCPKLLPKDHVIIEPGTVPEYCYLVKKGRVVAYEFTFRGEERVFNFMEENSIFLEANLLTNVPAQIYFKTAVPSEIICVKREKLIRAMTEDSQLMLDIIESVSDKFFSAMDQIREETAHNATWKICNLLLIFADRHGVIYDKKTLINEKLSQQMLSNLLGINRITTVRIMKDLKNLNLIEQINGYYCIRDIEKLKQHIDYLSLNEE